MKMNKSIKLNDTEKHIALNIMENDYDSIPLEYRNPLTNALKWNLSVKPEIQDWLHKNDLNVHEMRVDVNSDDDIEELIKMLTRITKEPDERS